MKMLGTRDTDTLHINQVINYYYMIVYIYLRQHILIFKRRKII